MTLTLANIVFYAAWLTIVGALLTAGIRMNRPEERPGPAEQARVIVLAPGERNQRPVIHQHVHLHAVTDADVAAINTKRRGALPRPGHLQGDK